MIPSTFRRKHLPKRIGELLECMGLDPETSYVSDGYCFVNDPNPLSRQKGAFEIVRDDEKAREARVTGYMRRIGSNELKPAPQIQPSWLVFGLLANGFKIID